MNLIVNFFNHPFFIVIGGISTILMISGFVYTAHLIICGVLPVWYRLGIGLSKRKIAIFADTEYNSLKSMLVDSGVFKKYNILQIGKNELKKSKKERIFLVHWKDYRDKMDEILGFKEDSTALVIYAPQSEGEIDGPMTTKINEHRNSIIVNFRGRLLNDILISMITISL